jgi:hypothetical protein
MPILAYPDAVYPGLDLYKDFISAGILNAGCEGADVEEIFASRFARTAGAA